ncbi:MAG: hypothetical protein DI498_00245 [Paracoccus denitrificans]|nr:MAG: hypothetical protein DI498_00245 [Paracoccus denitrificans]PZO86202.1 MAG: hypothetical protein DI633_00245 [Paracoccus denitrificans]
MSDTPKPTAPRVTLHYVADGYDPQIGLNGRRMAGQSFLRAMVEQSRGDLHAAIRNPADIRRLRSLVSAIAPEKSVNTVMEYDRAMRDAGVLMHPGIGVAGLAWARMTLGQSSYAICGMTHTLATRMAMGAVAELGYAPIAPWDAVICTSRAARSMVKAQLEVVADYQRHRFGPDAVKETGPMLPVIPLGIHCADFAPDAGLRAGLRERLGIADDAILCMVLGRLTIFGKYDPIPLFMAMQKAADQSGRTLHLALVGQMPQGSFADDYNDAARLMPDVRLHLVDGSAGDMPQAAFSASDIFVFPIDNLQETFGLAPVEAMAAGLPVVATDWDGLRDTIAPDCGFLVPTMTGTAAHSLIESRRYHCGTDGEAQFHSLTASMAVFDIEAMASHIARLASDTTLRKKMGEAAARRAGQVYDWSVVLPQMQALWAEQARRLATAGPAARQRRENPMLPSAFGVFRDWPTKRLAATALFSAVLGDRLPTVAELSKMRQTDRLKRALETTKLTERVLNQLRATPEPISAQTLSVRTRLSPLAVERICLWLAKYGLVRVDTRG